MMDITSTLRDMIQSRRDDGLRHRILLRLATYPFHLSFLAQHLEARRIRPSTVTPPRTRRPLPEQATPAQAQKPVSTIPFPLSARQWNRSRDQLYQSRNEHESRLSLTVVNVYRAMASLYPPTRRCRLGREESTKNRLSRPIYLLLHDHADIERRCLTSSQIRLSHNGCHHVVFRLLRSMRNTTSWDSLSVRKMRSRYGGERRRLVF